MKKLIFPTLHLYGLVTVLDTTPELHYGARSKTPPIKKEKTHETPIRL